MKLLCTICASADCSFAHCVCLCVYVNILQATTTTTATTPIHAPILQDPHPIKSTPEILLYLIEKTANATENTSAHLVGCSRRRPWNNGSISGDANFAVEAALVLDTVATLLDSSVAEMGVILTLNARQQNRTHRSYGYYSLMLVQTKNKKENYGNVSPIVAAIDKVLKSQCCTF